jgi:hypothetical protein
MMSTGELQKAGLAAGVPDVGAEAEPGRPSRGEAKRVTGYPGGTKPFRAREKERPAALDELAGLGPLGATPPGLLSVCCLRFCPSRDAVPRCPAALGPRRGMWARATLDQCLPPHCVFETPWARPAPFLGPGGILSNSCAPCLHLHLHGNRCGGLCAHRRVGSPRFFPQDFSRGRLVLRARELRSPRRQRVGAVRALCLLGRSRPAAWRSSARRVPQ